MSHCSMYNIVHDDLGCRKVCGRWVPRQLSDNHKHARQTIYQEHLDCHAREGDAFLHRIVTGDESWVYHYETENKTHCLQPTKNSRHRLPLGKSCWPSFSGTILVPFQEKGQTVTSARYSDMLVNELKPAIRSKCWGLLSKRVLLLHNNVHPHMVAHTVDTLCALKFEVLKHPSYSPDLVPSDFHLFGPMKENLWPEVCRCLY